MKLMSLFDGSGGFPLAASLCGIEPVYASEVEPYPIAVTKSRFPSMKHLGDVSMINGADIEPVDIITFGSPCQDMSVAGKRAGLKHTAVGDDETTRSGLFLEAIRIIKEMRLATNGALRTELLTLNTGECPSVAVESTLSQILEADVPEKYYLSTRACEGILRRAERRGKKLPEILEMALKQMIERETV